MIYKLNGKAVDRRSCEHFHYRARCGFRCPAERLVDQVLVDRIVADAEAIIKGRLESMVK